MSAILDDIRREMRVPDPTPRELRQFGIGLGGAGLVLTAILYWKRSGFWSVPLAVGLLILGVALLAPGALRGLFRVWMPVARLVGFLLSRLMLVALYYLIFTPLALVIRRFRSDPLDRRMRDRESYWLLRKNEEYDPASSERMY